MPQASLAPIPVTAPPLAPCCTEAEHESRKARPSRWKEALFVGYQSDGLPNGCSYELRNCPRCGSTLARRVEVLRVRYVRCPRPAVPRRAAAGSAAHD